MMKWLNLLLILVFGAGLIYLSVDGLKRDRDFRNRGKYSAATTIDVKEIRNRNFGSTSITYEGAVRFQPEGSQPVTLYLILPDRVVGDIRAGRPVYVEYLPEQPRWGRLKGFESGSTMQLLFGLAILLCGLPWWCTTFLNRSGHELKPAEQEQGALVGCMEGPDSYVTRFNINELIPVAVPADICCNCGSDIGVTLITTRLVKTTYLLMGGTETTISLSLPFCKNCAVTATRLPVGISAKLLISAMLFFASMLTWTFLPDNVSRFIPGGTVIPALAILSCAVVFGYFPAHRTGNGQTSRCQPVRLKRVKGQLLGFGEATGCVLEFTNDLYRSKFNAANRDAIARKIIETLPA
jgi:hypothetical protein